jgi:hypothetical protein
MTVTLAATDGQAWSKIKNEFMRAEAVLDVAEEAVEAALDEEALDVAEADVEAAEARLRAANAAVHAALGADEDPSEIAAFCSTYMTGGHLEEITDDQGRHVGWRTIQKKTRKS